MRNKAYNREIVYSGYKLKEKIMKLHLNDDMILAIQVALDELNNSGDWCNYLYEEEVDRIMDGIQQIREQIEKLK
jgi:Mg2+ and Co2+ transporter CorA